LEFLVVQNYEFATIAMREMAEMKVVVRRGRKKLPLSVLRERVGVKASKSPIGKSYPKIQILKGRKS
jgi:hypothetical protein